MNNEHNDLSPADITPETLFWNRRRFMQAAGAGLASLSAAACIAKSEDPTPSAPPQKRDMAAGEQPNTWEEITEYNNYYEFGTGKTDPAKYADALALKPWTLTVDGECEAGGQFDLYDLLKDQKTEERIYRLRCVEAWSMVVPWQGFELSTLLKLFKPTENARYVAFETAVRPNQMRLNHSGIEWPYREGLRMDEAMHPLSFLATGLYGKALPKQNGAPIRLVVPWKYGFKSIKSLVRIRFSKDQPDTTWNQLQASEYGFYANVNPKVSHPRWSQARERRIGELFKRETLMFNGYEEQVASLYEGMDLRKHY